MNSINDDRGEIAGRRAAEQFKRAAAEGVPFDKVPACRPLPGLAAQAENLLSDSDPSIRATGRFWLAFLASFSATFPEFFDR
jgi:hypothetical protein